jgi:hypothetical protein
MLIVADWKHWVRSKRHSNSKYSWECVDVPREQAIVGSFSHGEEMQREEKRGRTFFKDARFFY